VQARRAAEQARRAAAREDKIAAGIEELDRFLRDLVRQGLAGVQGRQYSFWDAQAARLVDAQAPGLARLVRELAGVAASGEKWQDRLLRLLSRLHLIVEGYKRLEQLSPGLQADLRAIIGVTVRQEDLLAKEGVRDQWQVVGQRVDVEDRLKVQRSWLIGQETQKSALVLQFAHGTQPLDISIVPGSVLDAEVVFFPSSYPLRAIIKTRHSGANPLRRMQGQASIQAALEGYSQALARVPLIELFPLALEAVVPVHERDAWRLRDGEGNTLPFLSAYGEGWRLAALSGNAPIGVFGEWDGEILRMLGVCAADRFVPFGERESAGD
jgi:hypothetical protein